MTDADFFRRLVAERAGSTPRIEFISDAWEKIVDLYNESRVRFKTDFKTEAQYHAAKTEVLIKVAALCERAAVDLTIPASRAKKKGTRK